MRHTYTRLFVHAVWATWDRAPLITPALERAIYADITVECQKLRTEVIEIGGVEDHVHVLPWIPPTVCVADLLKQAKGASSHMTTHGITGREGFKWQGAYAAFSVSESDVPSVREYIRNQKQHRGGGDVRREWEPEVMEHD